MENVRMCRSCGHIDAADSKGRCRNCGLFSELAILPRPEAEQLVRQQRRRAARRRLLRLTVALALLGGATVWALGVFFDLGPSPPRATTRVSASSAPGDVVGMKCPASMVSMRAPGICFAMPSVTETARMKS